MKTRKELGDTPVTGGYPNSPDHAPDSEALASVSHGGCTLVHQPSEVCQSDTFDKTDELNDLSQITDHPECRKQAHCFEYAPGEFGVCIFYRGYTEPGESPCVNPVIYEPDPADLIEKQLDFLDPDDPDEADDDCPDTTYDKDPYALTAAYPPPYDNPLFLTNRRTPLPPGAKYAAPIKMIKCPIIAYRSSNDMVIRGYFITDLHGRVPERAKKLCNNLSLSLLQVGSPTPISALIDPRAKGHLTEPLSKDILFAEKVWISDGAPDADTWRE